MIVVAFISSVLLALVIGITIGAAIAVHEYEGGGKKDKSLSEMTDEEIRARYIL